MELVGSQTHPCLPYPLVDVMALAMSCMRYHWVTGKVLHTIEQHAHVSPQETRIDVSIARIEPDFHLKGAV